MDTAKALRGNLTAESKAYGYTLSVWGTGAVLITSYEALMPETILLYVLGGTIGFGLMAYFAFKSLFRRFDYEREEKMIVASMVHVIASFGTVLISYIALQLLKGTVPPEVLGLVLGMHAMITYNLLLLIEDRLFSYFIRVEEQLTDHVSAVQNV